MRYNPCFRRQFGLLFPLFFTAASAFAAPAVLLETTRLVPADGSPNGGYGRSVAIDGNIAVVGANGGHPQNAQLPGAAYVFERNAQGLWRQTAKFTRSPDQQPDLFGIDVAIDGNVIAVGEPSSQSTHVFEKQGANWVRTAVLGSGAATGNGHFVAVHGNLIAISHMYSNGLALYRRGASGWQQVTSYEYGYAEEDPTYVGPRVELTANIAVFTSPPLVEDGAVPGRLFLYSAGANGNWAAPTITSWPHPDGGLSSFLGNVSISGNSLLASGLFYQRNSSGSWVLTNRTTRGTALDDDESTIIARDLPYILGRVYQRDAANAWSRVAELASSTAVELTNVDVNSKRVVAGSYPAEYLDTPQANGQAFVFELPTTFDRPPLLQDDFQDGNAQGWTPLGGSFGVVSNGRSLVYRQSNTTGNAAALMVNVNHGDQTIQADIVPRAFDGADRWFGLVARYVDSSNYYYVTARSGGGIQLKKMRGGSFTTLGSAPLTVTLNRTHRVRLEAVRGHVRVLVNERPVIAVRDNDISGGHPGVMMYRARADYDNVLVNANPGALAFVDDFSTQRHSVQTMGQWGLVWWGRYDQRDLTGGAYLITSPSGDNGTYGDQIVEADLLPMAFSGADRWIGLAARHVDPNNYVYVTLRSSNTLQIKKLVNGAIHTLASAPFSVATDTMYRVRLEAVGSRIRAYVNGELRLEASDTPNTPGAKRAGVVMYKTAAEVDNLSVFQP